MDINKLCPHCMREIKGDMGASCPFCGHAIGRETEVQHQLRPFTILQGKYLVGDVLGEGGFGITYIGFDLNLEIRVAIKEFYPNGYATREANVTNELTAYAGQSMEVVYKWRDNFLKEARSLAKCAHLPGVVGVKDFFQENNTAYIVQEYLEGMTLKEYAKSLGGKIETNQLLVAIEPVLSALGEVHKEGLIHRDISPDNIMLLKSGQMKLLDFGAARDFTEGGEKSLSVLLKPGYAPEEQYRTKGNQGPWSDIYALAGTIYKCITGITPPEAMERMRQDELIRPSALGIAIEPNVEQALLKGMAVFAENRYQTMEEFHCDLYGKGQTSVLPGAPVNTDMSQNQMPAKAQTAVQEEKPLNQTVSQQNHVSASQALPTQSTAPAKQVYSFLNKYKIPFAVALGVVVVTILVSTFMRGGNDDRDKEQLAADAQNVSREIEITPTAEQNEKEPVQETEILETQETETEQQSEEDDTAIHTYELIVDDVTWTSAYYDCIERGGHLVRINTEAEFNAIADQIRWENKQNITFWIGSNRAIGTDEYYWVYEDGTYKGEVLNNNPTYADFWLSGEPSYMGVDENYGNVEENCVNMFYRSSENRFYWNDAPDDIISVASYFTGKIGYICEYDNYYFNEEQMPDYILPYSASAYLTEADLAGLTSEQLRIARNEIYARHGRIFKDEQLAEYFGSKSWYYPVTEEVLDTELNEYEIANRDLIVSLENAAGE